MIRPIVTYPDARLRQASHSVVFEGDTGGYFSGRYAFGTESLHGLARDLVDTIRENRAMGLAAVQIGVQLRVFAILTSLKVVDQSISAEVIVACNPTVISTNGSVVAEQEGCLSFPGAFVRKDAPLEMLVRFQDVEGREHEIALAGIEARAFGHETDHTNGVLLIDSLGPMQRRAFLGDVDRSRAKAASDRRIMAARAPN